MKRIKVLGLCVVATFAFSAVAVATASAAEGVEWFECAKVAGGKYEKGCKKEGGKGGYVLRPGIGKGKAYKGTGGKATLHTPAIGGEITCTAFKDTGVINTTTTTDKVVSTFTGCSTLGKKCKSGTKAGEIKTHDLAGEFGKLEGEKGGVDLKAESGSSVANFECEGLVVEVTGSVIGEVTSNVLSKSSTDTFAVNSEGFQQWKKFESGPTDTLEAHITGVGNFESGQQATATNKGEELELKVP